MCAYGCVCIWWLGVCISMRIVCMHREVVYAYGCVCVGGCVYACELCIG